MNPRWIVLKILDAIEFEGIFVHDALERETESLELSKQERGFIKKVVFGVLENRIYLDYVINRFSKVKVRKMKPAVRHTMRLSVYQLVFMDNIPQSAVCNEAVKLIKKRKMHSLSGFVNGVLRSISRSLDDIPLPDFTKEPVRYLSVKYSYEEALIERLLQDYTYEETESFLKVSNEEAPLTIRICQKTDRAGLGASLENEGARLVAAKWLSNAAYLEDIDRLETIAAFEEGLFTVQDESSMLVSEVGWSAEVKRVIDVCSAPGGKTTHVADLVGPEGQVKAFDISAKKTALIEENLERLQLENVQVAVGDAVMYREALDGWADLLIADVPCSGLGIIRKKPDIKWHVSREKIGDLALLQKEIMVNVSRYVKPGGVMIYSTCTVLAEENEDNVRWFLDRSEDYELEAIEGPYADAETGMVKLMPVSGGHDGFFIAKLRKKMNT